MKVFFVTLVDRGGMIHYASQLVNSLSNDIKAVILIGKNALIDNKTLFKNGTVYTLPLEKKTILSTLFSINTIIKQENPDIVHFTSAHWYYFFIRLFIMKRKKVITLHDITLHLGESTIVSRYLQEKMVSDADYIFVHGNTFRKELICRGVSASKITTIPIGVFSSCMELSNPDLTEDFSVLFFGRIQEYKGLQYLLQAMDQIQKEIPLKLVIAGNGDIRPYQSLIGKMKPELIEVHNRFIPDHEVASFFQRAIIIVLPYVEASQSGIIPIAYAFKKPVIVTKVGAIHEVVEDGISGIVIPPRDLNSLVVSIKKLASDKSLREKMGECGYLKVENDLSWEDIADATERVYRQLSLK